MAVGWRGAPVLFLEGFLFAVAGDLRAEEVDGKRLMGVSGSYQGIIDYREGEIEGDDVDFGSYLRLNLRPFFHERASFHFYGRVRADLDGESTIDGAFSRSNERVFQAYGEVEGVPEKTRFRAGRQWIHEVEGVHVDGIRGEALDLSGFDLLAFGGRAVSAYSSTDGHEVAGGAAGYRPFEGTELRVTGVRSDEENPITDDQVGLWWFQRLGAASSLHADYRFLNRRGKEFRLGGGTFLAALQTELQANYYRRVNRSPIPERDDVGGRRFSEFYELLREVQELDRYGLTATRYFGGRFALSAGFSLVDIRGEENPSNRETERYFASLHLFDFLLENLDVSVTGNFIRAEYDSESTHTAEYAGGSEEVRQRFEGEEESFLLTGEVGYRFSGALRVSAGSAYGDYDFSRSMDLDQAYSESFLAADHGYLVSGLGGRFITRTYFAEVRWKVHDRFSTRFLTEWDHSRISVNNDTEDYVRLLGSVTYTF